MLNHAFTVFGERRSHNRFTNQTQRTVKIEMVQCRVLRSENKHLIKHVIDFFEIGQNELARIPCVKTTYNKIKRTAKYKHKQLEGNDRQIWQKINQEKFGKLLKKQYKKKSPLSNTF